MCSHREATFPKDAISFGDRSFGWEVVNRILSIPAISSTAWIRSVKSGLPSPCPSVGVHILPQEGYLPNALSSQCFDLAEDLRQGPALLPPPEGGHHTVGAEVVAPLHDRHKGCDRTRRRLRDDVERGDPIAKARLRLPVSRLFQGRDHLGKTVDLVCAEDQIEIRHLLEEMLSPVLGQAASDADFQMRVLRLQCPESAQLTADLLRRFFPDAARIDDDQVRHRRIIRRLVAGLQKKGRHLFRVLNIHLTAKSLNIELFYRQIDLSILKHYQSALIYGRVIVNTFLSQISPDAIV